MVSALTAGRVRRIVDITSLSVMSLFMVGVMRTLTAGVLPTPVAVAPTFVEAMPSDPLPIPPAVEEGVVDPPTFIQTLRNELFARPGCHFVPGFHGGKASGIKMFGVKPDSALAKHGLRNGDVLKTINGVSLAAPEKMLALFTQPQDTTTFVVEFERDGKPRTLHITP